ncbi:hypothetical protein ACIRL2_40545 [Embleya sp. NPDC127516]|uniref:hypothetical protein n=1 Tax=Embleya sp. NPDC127516 TaxID=3363990 RepID=UPI00380EC428
MRFLGGTTVVTGAVFVKGRGTARRIAWEPGTVVRVLDVPRPCLPGQPDHAYMVVADTDDAPADALRREGHRVLGMRHRLDIPPAPTDRSTAASPSATGPPGCDSCLPTSRYTDADDELVVDPESGVVSSTSPGSASASVGAQSSAISCCRSPPNA